MMRNISDVLSVKTAYKPFFDHKYAFVQFTVSYYKAGDFVDYNEIINGLWDGQDSWNGKFVPSGNEVMGVESEQMVNGKWEKCFRNGIVLSKDTFAITDIEIFGNSIGGELALQFEMNCIGTDIFNGHEEDILRIAKHLPRPREKDAQYATFVTAWKMVYEEYNSYDSMWPEYESWAEMIGVIDLKKIDNCFLDGVNCFLDGV